MLKLALSKVKISVTAVLLLFTSFHTFGQDPFLPFLTGKAPVISEDLGTETTPEGLKIHKLVFKSRTVETPEGPKVSLVYAVIVHPAGKGPFPAIVRLHGGGGNADIPAAIGSAKDGYVSLVLDIPGVAGKAKSLKNTISWEKIPKIAAKPTASNSALFDAVLASIQSFYLLRAQPDVDKQKIAIAGASWGGYTATMVASILDKDIAGTYSAYGSGNFLKGAYEKSHIEKLPDAERAEWIKYLDPGSRAKNITKPYLIATASNDRHWSWMAVQATLADVKGPVYTFYSPNDNHAMKYQGSSLMTPFLNHYLKGGPDLPKVILGKSEKLKDGSFQINYTVAAAAKLVGAKVFYTSPADQPVWTERIWSSVDAITNGKGYRATIPAALASKPLDWYVLVTDNNPKLGKDTVSVSSLIQQLK
nr:acetylxylan esterase [Pedobacter sp. MC2016-14]